MTAHGDPILRRDRFSELASGFRQSAVILTANQLGIFRLLSEAPTGLDAMAEKLALSKRGLDKLMNALMALDLIIKQNDLYELHGDAEEFLKEGSEYYLGDIFRHNYRLMKRWVMLDEAVRLGHSPFLEERKRGRSPDDTRSFILGMENISRTVSHELVEALSFEGVKRILDLGGGPGTYLYTFLRHAPDASGVLLDFPPVVEIAREQAVKAGMIDRVDFIEGNMLEADYGGGYDLIYLGNIIHSFGESDIVKVFHRATDALNPAGRLVVKDFFLDETGTRPLHAALFALNMLIGTEEGSAYRWIDAKTWMVEAGLKIEQSFKMARHSGVIVGRK